MRLTEMSTQVFDYLKENGEVSVAELATACNRTERSVGANLTDLQKKGLAERVKKDVEGAEKPVTYAHLTPAGIDFVPSDED